MQETGYDNSTLKAILSHLTHMLKEYQHVILF